VNHKVYLAGPISGLDYEGCTDWRDEAIRKLAAVGIVGASPMRAKHALKNVGILPPVTTGIKNPLATHKGIMSRDHHDTITADALLINLKGATRVSIGTMMELAWAYDHHIPTVVIIEADGSNLHEHGMVDEAIKFRAESLDEALHYIETILCPNPMKWVA
jgi:nucleoside 2-deoxyribosyltransferase